MLLIYVSVYQSRIRPLRDTDCKESICKENSKTAFCTRHLRVGEPKCSELKRYSDQKMDEDNISHFFSNILHLLSLPNEGEGQGPHCFLVKPKARHCTPPRRSKDALSLGWVLTQAGREQQAGSTNTFRLPVSALSALENKVLPSPLFPWGMTWLASVHL